MQEITMYMMIMQYSNTAIAKLCPFFSSETKHPLIISRAAMKTFSPILSQLVLVEVSIEPIGWWVHLNNKRNTNDTA